jgi:hypothetical protein
LHHPTHITFRYHKAGPVVWVACIIILKHNRSGMVAVLGPVEALPCYIHTYRHTHITFSSHEAGLVSGFACIILLTLPSVATKRFALGQFITPVPLLCHSLQLMNYMFVHHSNLVL